MEGPPRSLPVVADAPLSLEKQVSEESNVQELA